MGDKNILSPDPPMSCYMPPLNSVSIASYLAQRIATAAATSQQLAKFHNLATLNIERIELVALILALDCISLETRQRACILLSQ